MDLALLVLSITSDQMMSAFLNLLKIGSPRIFDIWHLAPQILSILLSDNRTFSVETNLLVLIKILIFRT